MAKLAPWSIPFAVSAEPRRVERSVGVLRASAGIIGRRASPQPPYSDKRVGATHKRRRKRSGGTADYLRRQSRRARRSLARARRLSCVTTRAAARVAGERGERAHRGEWSARGGFEGHPSSSDAPGSGRWCRRSRRSVPGQAWRRRRAGQGNGEGDGRTCRRRCTVARADRARGRGHRTGKRLVPSVVRHQARQQMPSNVPNRLENGPSDGLPRV